MRQFREAVAKVWAAIRPRFLDKDVRATKRLVADAFNREFPHRDLSFVRFLGDEETRKAFRAVWRTERNGEQETLIMPGDYETYVLYHGDDKVKRLQYEVGHKEYCWPVK